MELQVIKMVNRFFNTAFWLTMIAVLVIASGCAEYGKIKPGKALINPEEPLPDYAHRTFNATGGQQSWLNTERLELDAIVTFNKSDGSRYLTKHYYEIYPWAGSIRVFAMEPEGKVVWQLLNGEFESFKKQSQPRPLPVDITENTFAEAILSITTTPVMFLDEHGWFVQMPGILKVEGLWYYKIERAAIYKPIRSKAVFYQNKTTSLIDMLWLPQPADQTSSEGIMIRGYNYRETANSNVLIPVRIEIFKTNKYGALLKKLVTIDFQ